MTRIIFVTLLMMASSIVPENHGHNYLFHLPWACAVLYNSTSPAPGKLIGACAIFTPDHVLVSVDNFRLRPNKDLPPVYEQIEMIYVCAGSNYMNGTKNFKTLPYAQIKAAENLFIGKTKRYSQHFDSYIWDEYISKPITHDKYEQVQKDGSEISYNVGILKVTSRFIWTEYVRPITMNFLSKGAQFPSSFGIYYNQHLFSENPPKTKCVTYSWNEKENKIRYYEVMHIPRRYCINLFCTWDLINCELFPNRVYLYCFKSTKFEDVCPNARGAALYCPNFYEHSVLAILTTAPSCGLSNMPGVYSSIELAIRLYELIYPSDFSQLHRPRLKNVFDLNQQNEDYEGIY